MTTPIEKATARVSIYLYNKLLATGADPQQPEVAAALLTEISTVMEAIGPLLGNYVTDIEELTAENRRLQAHIPLHPGTP